MSLERPHTFTRYLADIIAVSYREDVGDEAVDMIRELAMCLKRAHRRELAQARKEVEAMEAAAKRQCRDETWERGNPILRALKQARAATTGEEE